MSSIIICSQCGTQNEGHKTFCANCGAMLISPSNSNSIPNSSRARGLIAPSQTTVAASTLFTALQHKKQENDSETTTERTINSSTSILNGAKKSDRPKTFVTKPLGTINPHLADAKIKQAAISTEERARLIEFLRGLNKLDRFLEASAVVKRDGTLFASAHSTRAKPDMMATISSTLFGIGADSIRAIAGGKMRLITIIAEQCVLMLSPINEDTILILVTSPKSNLGLLTMQSELVSQNIAKYLATISHN